MRSLVLCNVGQFELREVQPQSVGVRDVKVRVSAVGVCGTDFLIFSGQANLNKDKQGKLIPLQDMPQILGHEIVGVVEEVGGRVEDLRVGDTILLRRRYALLASPEGYEDGCQGHRVVLDQGLNCISSLRQLCEYCASGDSHQCQFFGEHGIRDFQENKSSKTIYEEADNK